MIRNRIKEDRELAAAIAKVLKRPVIIKSSTKDKLHLEIRKEETKRR